MFQQFVLVKLQAWARSLANGADKKRFALPNSRVMIHQPLGGARGQASDIEIQAKEILHFKDKLNKILAEKQTKPQENPD